MSTKKPIEDTTWLQQAFQQREPNIQTPDCPSSDTIFAAATGELTGAKREAVIDHLAICAHCAQAWQLAHALEPQQEQTASNKVVQLKPRYQQAPVALAAAATLLLGVSITVVDFDTSPNDAYRGGPVSHEQGAQPQLVNNGTSLSITWPAMAPRTSAEFELRVFDGDFNVIYSHKQTGSADFKVNIQQSLPTAKTIFWQMEATLIDGTSVKSQSAVAEIKPAD